MEDKPDWSQELLAIEAIDAFNRDDMDRLEELIPEHEEGPLTRGLISLGQWFASRAAYELGIPTSAFLSESRRHLSR